MSSEAYCRGISRRRFISTGISLACAYVLAGCAPSTLQPTPTKQEVAATDTPAPKEQAATPTLKSVPEAYNRYTGPREDIPPGKLQLYVGLGPEGEKTLSQEFKEVFQKFNPGVTVEILNVAGEEKLLALLAAGTPPDVWWTPHGGTIQVADGSILDIRPILEGDPIMEDILPVYLEPYVGLDGGVYGLPNGTWFWLIYYNKKLLEEAGVPFPTKDWTWDDLLSSAKELTKTDEAGKTTQWGYNNGGVAWGGGSRPFIYSNGGKEISDDGTRFLLDSDEAIEALQFLYDLVHDHKVMPAPDFLKGLGITDRQAFSNRSLAMHTDGCPPDWTFPMFTEALSWEELDCVVLPHPKGKTLVNWAGFGGFSISAKTSNPKAAFELLKFLARGSNVWWPDPCYRSGISAYVETHMERQPQLAGTSWKEMFEFGISKVWFNYTSNPFRIFRYAGRDWGAFNDRLWTGKVTPQELKTEVPKWNAKYAEGLEKDLREVPLKPAYKEALEKLLEELKARA